MELLAIPPSDRSPCNDQTQCLIVPGGTISALFVLVELLGSVCCVGGPEGAVWQDGLRPKGPARGEGGGALFLPHSLFGAANAADTAEQLSE